MENNHTLYLTGKKAYRADTYGRSGLVNKADFEQLVAHLDEFDVIVPEATAPKYARRINRLGFVLTAEEQYSDLCGELKLHYRRLKWKGGKA